MHVARKVRFRIPLREARQPIYTENRLEATVQTRQGFLYCLEVELRVAGEDGEQEGERIRPGSPGDGGIDVVHKLPVQPLPRDSWGCEHLRLNCFLKAHPGGSSELF